jgi:hypothetical protein
MNFSIDIENEIDAIRDKIYAKTKDMSPEDRAAYINSRAEAVMKQLETTPTQSSPGAYSKYRR